MIIMSVAFEGFEIFQSSLSYIFLYPFHVTVQDKESKDQTDMKYKKCQTKSTIKPAGRGKRY